MKKPKTFNNNDYEFFLKILRLLQFVISKLELKEVIKEILKRGTDVLEVNHMSLLIIEDPKFSPVAYEIHRDSNKFITYKSTARLKKGISGTILKTKKPVIINDLEHYKDVNPVALKKGRRSVLAYPLTYKDKIIGIFYADSDKPNFFKSDDIRKVELFALNAGTALMNAKTFEEAKKKQDKLNLLYRTSECLISSLDIKKVLKNLMNELKQSLCIDYTVVFWYDKEKKILVPIAYKGYKSIKSFSSKLEGNSITLNAINTKKYYYAGDIKNDKYYVKVVDKIKSEISFPLIIGNDVIGAITCSKVIVDGFSDEEIETLITISNNLAITVHNYFSFKKVETFSITDPLTNTANRRKIEEEIEKEIERSKRYSKMFSILFIDLDNFKNYNDKYGHLMGDDILKKVTGIIKENIRNIDIIGRYGGDEFIVLLVEAGYDKAEQIAKRLIERIKNEMKKHKITLSIGISVYPINGLTKLRLIHLADTACYDAKKEGGNRCKISRIF